MRGLKLLLLRGGELLLVLLVTVVFSVWALWVTFRDGSRFYNPFI